METENSIENIGENHHPSLLVTNGHKNETGGGYRTKFELISPKIPPFRASTHPSPHGEGY
jgi:hypothetical protein